MGVQPKLGPVYDEQVVIVCRLQVVVTRFFNIVSYFGAKKSARCKQMLVLNEIVAGGTQYICDWGRLV